MDRRHRREDMARQMYLRRIATELVTKLPEECSDAYQTLDLMRRLLDEWLFVEHAAGPQQPQTPPRLTLVE